MFAYKPLEQETKYEIWNGKLLIKEPSSTYHENVLSNIVCFIASHVRHYDLGRVYMSNTGVYLNPNSKDFVMPDLTYVSHSRKSIVKPNGVWGSPDLVVEIVSPGIRNTRRDTLDKFHLYEQFGVKEYWLVDYIEQQIHMYALSEGKYVLIEESEVLQGIHLPHDQLFDTEEEV